MIKYIYIDNNDKNYINIYNSLINMYGKCGDLENAINVWEFMCDHNDIKYLMNVSSWNAMLHVYGINNCGQEAFKLFNEMKQKGFEPDHVTYTTILNACSHSLLFQNVQQILREIDSNTSESVENVI
eukprot:99758_1